MNICYANVDELASAMYARPTQQALATIQSNVATYMAQSVHIPQAIMATIKQGYQTFVDHSLGNGVAALRSKLGMYWRPDTIATATTIEELQTAKPTMSRWLMTSPVVREAVASGNLSGYAGQYVDPQPGLSGPAQKDWRQVNTGVVQHSDSGVHVSTYYERYGKDSVYMSAVDKGMVKASIAMLEYYATEGDFDPTSVWNEPIY